MYGKENFEFPFSPMLGSSLLLWMEPQKSQSMVPSALLEFWILRLPMLKTYVLSQLSFIIELKVDIVLIVCLSTKMSTINLTMRLNDSCTTHDSSMNFLHHSRSNDNKRQNGKAAWS